MSRERSSSAVLAPPQPGDLARLLETERRLEQRLRAARAQAEDVMARAQADAARREAALEVELQAEERRLDETLDAERRARDAEISEDARRAAAVYDGVAPARLAALARELAERFLVP